MDNLFRLIPVVLFSLGFLPGGIAAEPRGANVPWTRYEAEDCALSGHATVEGPSVERGTFPAESSGRKCVRLSGAGDAVEFTAKSEFAGIVIRLAIPDAPGGEGIDDTLLVTIGAREFRIPLTSKYAWQYGDEGANKGVFGNAPPAPGYTGPLARKRFDDVRQLLPESIPAGTRVKLQKPQGGRSDWIYLDLVETEPVPPPVARPSGFLAVTDPAFGAIADDGGDDLAVFNACIAEAKKRHTGVYVPTGSFCISQAISVSDVVIQGAGMWHTCLLFTSAEPRGSGFLGVGGNVTVADCSVTGTTAARISTRGLSGCFGTGSTIRSVWIERVGVGAWIATYPGVAITDGLVISHCRIRNTFADGINFAKGTRHSVVEHCHLRGTMDDALATWSSDAERVPPTEGNVFRYNTVENTLRAGGIGIFGGGGHEVHHNLVADTLVDGGIRFSTTFPGHKFSADSFVLVQNNTLVRCGGIAYRNKQGAVNFEVVPIMGDIQNIKISHNTIIDPSYYGVSIRSRAVDGKTSAIREVEFADNSISGAGEYGIFVHDGAVGEISLVRTVIEHAQKGEISNQSKLEILTR